MQTQKVTQRKELNNFDFTHKKHEIHCKRKAELRQKHKPTFVRNFEEQNDIS